jgi:hypothetical protein
VWKTHPQPRIKPVIAGDTTYGVSLLTGTTSGSNFAIPEQQISGLTGMRAEFSQAVVIARLVRARGDSILPQKQTKAPGFRIFLGTHETWRSEIDKPSIGTPHPRAELSLAVVTETGKASPGPESVRWPFPDPPLGARQTKRQCSSGLLPCQQTGEVLSPIFC